MKYFVLLILSLSILSDSNSQVKFAVSDKLYTRLQSQFDASNAYNTTAFVEKRWRLAGNPDFDECIYYVEDILKKAGYINESRASGNDMLTYRIEKRKLKKPAWQPVDGSLSIDGIGLPLLEYKSNKNMIAINSSSTPAEGVTGEIAYIGKGTDAEIKDKELAGKILLGTGSPRSLHGIAMKYKALGILIYSIPAYNQAETHVKSISFQGIPYLDSLQNKWCVLLSLEAYGRINSELEKRKVKATVRINTRFYNNEELTLIADVKGKRKPAERFVFSAHVQEPGANDNASGVGALSEMARVTAELIRRKQYTPDRSISFLWGDEIVSTNRYIQEDSVRRKGIRWGLSLDMVGEDVSKTGGSFLIEKMPDPSAIWTRGDDKHTKWGGHILKQEELFPHYFNDLLFNRCMQQATYTSWIINTNPFEGGSDHTPFLEAHIPGLLMWHFTDVYYHTDGDRIDMVSAEELENVGVSALATAFTLCHNDERTQLALIHEFKQSAIQRLQQEIELSEAAIKSGDDKNLQQTIFNTWKTYYVEALDKTREIPIPVASKKFIKMLDAAKSEIAAIELK